MTRRTAVHSSSMTRRKLLCGAAAAAASSALPRSTRASDAYPRKPVRIIVPFTPAGSVDVSIRIMAQQLSLSTAKEFIVENRSGAGGNIGVAVALDAPADGYLLLGSGPNISTAPWMWKNVHFDPVTSFAHIARIAVDASTLSVPAGSQFSSLAGLLSFAQANPGRLSFGSSGVGTPGHLAMELLIHRAGVEMRHVPYRGGGLAMNDALGSQIDMVMIGTSQQLPHIRSGKLRALGVTTANRFFALPEVPAISELFPGYESATWFGLSGRAGIPTEVVHFIAGETQRVLADPEVQKRYRDSGFEPDYLGPEELSRHVAEETKMYQGLIKKIGITLD